MLVDYHTHHNRCGHAEGSMRDMIEQAIKLNMHQIGLSDHTPLFFKQEDHANPGMTMAKSEFPHYVAEMISLQKEYKEKIDVRIGVESDYIPGWEKAYKKIFSTYPFDYIIGSVHYFGGYHVFDPQRRHENELDENDIFSEYFSLVCRAANSKMFDILGHIDAVKGLGHVPSKSLSAQLDKVVEAIQFSEAAVELNTSGIRKCDDIFPSMELLERLHRVGVPFTYGSDAHKPEQIGDHWDKVYDTLTTLGVKDIVTFKKRKQIKIPLQNMRG